MFVTRVEDLKAYRGRRNGMGSKPNVYKRSFEARQTTQAYLDAVMQQAATGESEPPPDAIRNRALDAAIVILLGVAIIVAMRVL